MARVIVIQHLEPEAPVAIGDALNKRGVEVDIVRVDLGDVVPATLAEVDGLVVMGGPMSARSDDNFRSRTSEIALIAEAVAAGVPFLGVCLGAQLLAAAAGGSVESGSGAEVGWAPVTLSPGASSDPLLRGLPRTLTVLHWHGETVKLPAGSTHLAGTKRYPNQAFRVGRCAWGLQFHIEVDRAATERFVEVFPTVADAAPGGAGALLADTDGAISTLIPYRDEVLGRFADIVASRGEASTAPSE